MPKIALYEIPHNIKYHLGRKHGRLLHSPRHCSHRKPCGRAMAMPSSTSSSSLFSSHDSSGASILGPILGSIVAAITDMAAPAIKGSRSGRAPNRDKQRAAHERVLQADYFGLDGRPPVFSEDEFERDFRMPRSVYRGCGQEYCTTCRSTSSSALTQPVCSGQAQIGKLLQRSGNWQPECLAKRSPSTTDFQSPQTQSARRAFARLSSRTRISRVYWRL
ncbi:unnamed protein product [Chondrus crispus]|uniref:Uncharacterized protein n=1 Tax=Chondrus crispus TaxID=2769 RepID=R7QDW9_CHOCR|nr:unnamed protein product [Chondrus crispus]CDF36712.1 unnamed protein product [Chondrus crispus]|eukprot:XP_005716531.1 unnamed protein product [Chondrus crispus]